MKRLALVVTVTVAAVLAGAGPAHAHGIGGRLDLPVPLSYFIVGASAVLVVSFVLLAVLWVEPRLQGGPRNRPLRVPLVGPLLGLLRALGIVGLVLVIVAGLFGTPAGSRNIAPVLVWVYLWLVVPFLGVAVGNLWTPLNPWRTLGGVAFGTVPDRDLGAIGIYPAAVALVGFTWLELVYPQSSLPLALALAAVGYSLYLAGVMARAGVGPGLQAADAFTSYNRFLTSISPFGRATDGGLVWRGWLRALPVLSPWRGSALFVVAMIGTVTYDGLSATPGWRAVVGDVASSVWFGTLALVGTVAIIGGGYRVACGLAVRLSGDRTLRAGTVARRFAHTLVPIAFAYAFAHYFTLVLFEGQILIAVASDPFGLGWNLFGTADYRIDFSLIGPTAVWLVQVTTIVSGHVAGVVLAHDRALADFPVRTAVRTQYAMLGLMVLLTALGLAILAAG